MFIGCPGADFDFGFETLGGVRIITRYLKTAHSADKLGGAGVDRIVTAASDRQAEFMTVDVVSSVTKSLAPAR